MRYSRWVLLGGIFSLACSAEIDAPPPAGASGIGGTSIGQAGMSPAGAPGTGGSVAGTGGTEAQGGAGAGGTSGTGSSMAGTTQVGGAGSGGEPSAGSGGFAGSAAGAAGMTPGLDSCPPPPAGVTNEAVVAANTANAIRVAMGLDCAELVPELITAAQNHCNYYVTNQGDDMCEAPSAHNEIEGCPEFTGEGLGDRMRAADYTGNPPCPRTPRCSTRTRRSPRTPPTASRSKARATARPSTSTGRSRPANRTAAVPAACRRLNRELPALVRAPPVSFPLFRKSIQSPPVNKGTGGATRVLV